MLRKCGTRNPADIRDTGLLEKVLTAMQSAIVILYGMAKKEKRTDDSDNTGNFLGSLTHKGGCDQRSSLLDRFRICAPAHMKLTISILIDCHDPVHPKRAFPILLLFA